LHVELFLSDFPGHKRDSSQDRVEISSLRIDRADLRLVFERVGLAVEFSLLTLQKLIFLLVLDRDARSHGIWGRHWHYFLRKFAWYLLHWGYYRLLICCFDSKYLLFFTLVESELLVEVLLIKVVVFIVLHHRVTVFRLSPV
jgi:hypothetical protein